jgi:hypothetical protein
MAELILSVACTINILFSYVVIVNDTYAINIINDGAMTFIIMTLSTKGLFVTLSITVSF